MQSHVLGHVPGHVPATESRAGAQGHAPVTEAEAWSRARDWVTCGITCQQLALGRGKRRTMLTQVVGWVHWCAMYM